MNLCMSETIYYLGSIDMNNEIRLDYLACSSFSTFGLR